MKKKNLWGKEENNSGKSLTTHFFFTTSLLATGFRKWTSHGNASSYNLEEKRI